MKLIKEFTLSLVDPKLMPTAVKVALVVGSILFTINHGRVLVKGEMNRERWLSGGLTYLVPYFVSIHGQYISRKNNKV
jgi:hypothetical protein